MPRSTETAAAPPTKVLPTLTQGPTLNPAVLRKQVTELISSNGGCRLPCWWGIRLGETTWQTTRDSVLAPLGWYTREPDSPETNTTQYFDPADENSVPFLDVEFLEKQGKVEAITLRWSKYRGNPFSSVNLRPLFLDSVLSRYGQPTRILVDLTNKSEVPFPYTYQLWLFYDGQGMLFEYAGTALEDQPITVCPSLNTIDTLNVFLISTHQDLTFDRYVGMDFGSEAVLGYLKPIEVATDLTPADFTRNFAALDNHPCFVSPPSIWQ